MKEQVFLSLIVYISHQNDYKEIPNFLKKVGDFFTQRFESVEIILVNDTEEDLVEKIKTYVTNANFNLSLINLAWKHNLETAMLVGTDQSIGDFIYEFESPMVHYPLSLLHDLFQKASTGYDIVVATPKNGVKLSSKLFYKFLNKVSYLNFDFSTETIRIVSRRALNATLKAKDKIRFRKALYKLTGYPYVSISYKPQGKIRTMEKPLGEKLSLALNILIFYSGIGPRSALIMSVLFLLISIIGGAYAFYTYLTLNTVVSGWTTLMLFLSFGFSGVFFVLGLIGKYIAVMLAQIMDRPNYTIKSVKHFPKQY